MAKHKDKKFLSRLEEARRRSYQKMKVFRESANRIKQQFVGHMYSGDGDATRQVLINKLQQWVNIFMRLLVSDTINVTVDTEYQNQRRFAETMRLGLNRSIGEINLVEAGRDCVLDAMFGLGMMKTGIAAGSEAVEIDGVFYDPGEVFHRRVDLDNLVVDMQARSYEEIDYIGDRFQRPKEWVKKQYGSKAVKDAVERREESDFNPTLRVSGVRDDPEENVYETMWIWDIYLPKEGTILTFADGSSDPIMEADAESPERGPYEPLMFQPVPGEILPVPPTHPIFEMHMMTNSLIRKIDRQSERSKKNPWYSGTNTDSMRLQQASDGEWVHIEHPEEVGVFDHGSYDPGNLSLLIMMLQQINLMGGNIDALAGLQPQSETAKQDTMLQESANTQVNLMQRAVMKFMSRIIKKQAWHLWTDPLREMQLFLRDENTDVSMPLVFLPEEREGDFLDYNFSIRPYTMRDETPQEQAQILLGFVTDFVLPTAQMAGQEEVAPNIEGIARKLCEHLRLPFELVYKALTEEAQARMQAEGGEVGAPSRLATDTNRTYTRISRTATTPRGNDVNMQQTLLGANPQNAEAAGLARPASSRSAAAMSAGALSRR